MEPTFDAATSAASQILQLPIEIIEMIGKECDSFQDVKNLRATHRQLAAYLDDMFYAKAQVHIAVDQNYLAAFESLANSSFASKVKTIKLANRHLSDMYSVLNVNRDKDEKCLAIHQDHKMTCELAELFAPALVPSCALVQKFADLVCRFENVLSIATYDVVYRATYRSQSVASCNAQFWLAHVSIGKEQMNYNCGPGRGNGRCSKARRIHWSDYRRMTE